MDNKNYKHRSHRIKYKLEQATNYKLPEINDKSENEFIHKTGKIRTGAATIKRSKMEKSVKREPNLDNCSACGGKICICGVTGNEKKKPERE